MWDMVVEGGTLVIPETGELRADLAIRDGRISAIGRDLGPGHQRVDADGLIVLPGLVDPHVHFGLAGRTFAEDAVTETAAALSGGVTTIGIFLRETEKPYSKALERYREEYEAGSRVDAFFVQQMFRDDQVEEVPASMDFGVAGFKVYTCGSPGAFPAVDDAFLSSVVETTGSEAADAVVAAHCENHALVMAATARILDDRPDGGLADWAEARPAEAEAEAIMRMAFFASRAQVRLYVVHLSSELGLRAALHARRWHRDLVIETTSMHLGVDTDDPNGLLAKRVPPVRTPQDRDALWRALANGHIDTVATDNTSCDRAAKNLGGGLRGSRGGGPLLATHLTALLHEGHHLRGVPLQRLAQVSGMEPAKVFGIYPRKGTIAVGSDADLAIVDLDGEREVDAARLPSFSDFSCFEGRRMRGWAKAVIKGGVLAFEDGELRSDAGSGSFLQRSWQRTG